MNTNAWKIDAAHSSVTFSIRHMVFAKVRGRFSSFEGQLELDDADLTRSSVEVTIDAASIDTGVVDRDNHLRSDDFLQVEAFPTLRFRSLRVEHDGGDRYRVIGELTIRDVTREVELAAELGGRAVDPWGNQRVAFTAKTSIDRTDYGLRWNQVLEAGGVLVGERLDIDIEVQAIAQAAADERRRSKRIGS